MTIMVVEKQKERRAIRISPSVPIPLWAEKLLRDEGMNLYVRSGKYEGCWIVESPSGENDDDFPSFTIVTDKMFSEYYQEVVAEKPPAWPKTFR